jgi:hypothetical protein
MSNTDPEENKYREADSSFDEDNNTKVALYTATLSMINADGQLIWSRYYAMLTANAFISVLLGAILAKAEWKRTDEVLIFAIGLFGLFLSFQWKHLTRRGWELQHCWVRHAESFKWKNFQNPLDPYRMWCKDSQCSEGAEDWISKYAQRVINLFIIGYCIASAYGLIMLICRYGNFLYTLLCTTKGPQP